MRFQLLAFFVFAIASVCQAVVGPGTVTGDTAVHDPSEIPRGLNDLIFID